MKCQREILFLIIVQSGDSKLLKRFNNQKAANELHVSNF